MAAAFVVAVSGTLLVPNESAQAAQCTIKSVTTTNVSGRVQGNSTTQCQVGLKGTITQRVFHRYPGIIPDAQVFWGAKLGPQNGAAFTYSNRRCDNQTEADYDTRVTVDYGGSKNSAAKRIRTCAGTGG
ncbi:hypothetical protein GCM10025867_11400 [Frondihabitans sucicola]|uniref:Secreted protein n=1 Tax=Frondihabitans sucicola TaxID=1268041 RepID=A0ABM8GKI1_9MICO|nr:hypothetical protein GCM10025867_11400 [Frondihabitans sucicola]